MKNKKKGVNFHIILYVCKNRLLFGIRLYNGGNIKLGGRNSKKYCNS